MKEVVLQERDYKKKQLEQHGHGKSFSIKPETNSFPSSLLSGIGLHT
jgi:hypothetical protein